MRPIVIMRLKAVMGDEFDKLAAAYGKDDPMATGFTPKSTERKGTDAEVQKSLLERQREARANYVNPQAAKEPTPQQRAVASAQQEVGTAQDMAAPAPRTRRVQGPAPVADKSVMRMIGGKPYRKNEAGSQWARVTEKTPGAVRTHREIPVGSAEADMRPALRKPAPEWVGAHPEGLSPAKARTLTEMGGRVSQADKERFMRTKYPGISDLSDTANPANVALLELGGAGLGLGAQAFRGWRAAGKPWLQPGATAAAEAVLGTGAGRAAEEVLGTGAGRAAAKAEAQAAKSRLADEAKKVVSGPAPAPGPTPKPASAVDDMAAKIRAEGAAAKASGKTPAVEPALTPTQRAQGYLKKNPITKEEAERIAQRAKPLHQRIKDKFTRKPPSDLEQAKAHWDENVGAAQQKRKGVTGENIRPAQDAVADAQRGYKETFSRRTRSAVAASKKPPPGKFRRVVGGVTALGLTGEIVSHGLNQVGLKTPGYTKPIAGRLKGPTEQVLGVSKPASSSTQAAAEPYGTKGQAADVTATKTPQTNPVVTFAGKPRAQDPQIKKDKLDTPVPLATSAKVPATVPVGKGVPTLASNKSTEDFLRGK